MREMIVVVLALVGCEGVIQGAKPEPVMGAKPAPTENPDSPVTHIEGPRYATARCEGVGSTRTFRGLDGRVLEETRADSAYELDRRRTRTWESPDRWASDTNDKFGYWRAADGMTGEAMLPMRVRYPSSPFVFAEPSIGALELYSQFRVGFLICQRMISNPPQILDQRPFVNDLVTGNPLPDFQAAPTGESARRRCDSMMRRFWRMIPSAEQVDACVQFAVTETATVSSQVSERWALVCAALFASSQSLSQ